MARHKGERTLPVKMLLALLGVFALFAGTLAATAVPASATGNNGTIKVHAEGSPPGTESNEPHVCGFDLEFYDFVENFDGYFEFDVQGGDGPTGVAAGPFAVGPANADGYFESQYFNVEGGPVIQNGHYKVTLYGKFNDGRINYDDEKAKSHVFKVDCPPSPTGDTVTVPTQETVDPCNPVGVTNNVAWKDSLPADTDKIDWSESNNGATRTAALKDSDDKWSDGTKEPKVFNLPADSGVKCEVTTTPPPVPTPTPIPTPVPTPTPTPTPTPEPEPNKAKPSASVNASCVTENFGEGTARLNNKKSDKKVTFRIVRSGPDKVVTVKAGKKKVVMLTGLRVGSVVKVKALGKVLAKTRVPAGCQPTPDPDTGFRMAASAT